MNFEKISPTDPRLSAYAFGEMEPAESAEFARQLEQDAEARAVVDELRRFGIQISTTLTDETVLLAESGSVAPAAPARVVPLPRAPRSTLSRGMIYWLGGLATAACFTFLLVDQQRQAGERRDTQAQLQTALEKAKHDRRLSEQKAQASVQEKVESFVVATPEASPAAPVAAAPATETPPVSLPLPAPAASPSPAVAALSTPTVALPPPAPALAQAGPSAPATAMTGAAGFGLSGETTRSRRIARMGAVVDSTSKGEEMLVAELDPFLVEEKDDVGYAASATLAGSRSAVRGAVGSAAGGRASAINTDQVTERRWGNALAKNESPDDEVIELSPFEVQKRPGFAKKIASWFKKENQSASATKLPKPVEAGGEGYALLKESGYSFVAANPTSTFSIDVDTASYANVRRFLTQGQRPPREAVRVEELINAFRYRYAKPSAQSVEPVAASLEVASAPWNPAHRLVRVGLQAKEIPAVERPASNLVFLLDVSGSMSDANKLPLVKKSLRLLVEQLRAEDRVAIVVYAGASGLALPSTGGDEKAEILSALESLQPGGSTAGAMGIQLAYDVAKANFIPGGTNRVILCTDGDFNVGVTSQTELQSLIETKAKSGVYLTVLGFGMGNYQDHTLELLADKGNGNYGYVDSEREARRLLVEQAGGTLVTVAKDVKVQVEFNPARVSAYRLIGYENRRLNREDFVNDRVDAGEMGSGQSVTALYEVVPVSAAGTAPEPVETLRYGFQGEKERKPQAEGVEGELLTVAVRYKPLDSDQSRKLVFPLVDRGGEFEAASADFRFATAVAGFGQVLTGSTQVGALTLDEVSTWTLAALSEQADAQRREFAELVDRARQLGAPRW